MIEICRLTKRQVEPDSKKLPHQLEQVKVFSMNVGHGLGSVDFVEKVDEVSDEEYEKMLQGCDKYAKFKLGNLTKYFEVEVLPEHAKELIPAMPECKLREHFEGLIDGYFILRKKV